MQPLLLDLDRANPTGQPGDSPSDGPGPDPRLHVTKTEGAWPIATGPLSTPLWTKEPHPPGPRLNAREARHALLGCRTAGCFMYIGAADGARCRGDEQAIDPRDSEPAPAGRARCPGDTDVAARPDQNTSRTVGAGLGGGAAHRHQDAVRRAHPDRGFAVAGQHQGGARSSAGGGPGRRGGVWGQGGPAGPRGHLLDLTRRARLRRQLRRARPSSQPMFLTAPDAGGASGRTHRPALGSGLQLPLRWTRADGPRARRPQDPRSPRDRIPIHDL
jgi:hypothetical protein